MSGTAATTYATPDAQAADLYDRFRLPVYRYCRGQLRSHDEAEDLGWARRACVERPHDFDALEDRLAAPEPERPEELGGLRDALAGMPERLRRVILLREWHGLSYAEIAESLGVSVSAVETLIFRGRRYLADALRGAEPEPQLLAAA